MANIWQTTFSEEFKTSKKVLISYSNFTETGWETKIFWHSPEAYTKFHLPRPVFHLPGQIFTRIGDTAGER